jgi:hypothetical protein
MMSIRNKSVIVFLALIMILICLNASPIQANPGVGIMPGSIDIDQVLLPGGYYPLPALQVFNTGDQISNYEISLARMEKQNELQPSEDFFFFEPVNFQLAPNDSQLVHINLKIPIRAEPGDYLAHIEAHIISQNQKGTIIGIAAATKLYFTVKQTGSLEGMIISTGSFFKRYSPISFILPSVIILAILLLLFRRYIKIEIKMMRKK